MKKQKPPLPSWVLPSAERWCALWGTPGLESRIVIEISTRMTRSLGHCAPPRGIVRLSYRLLKGPHSTFEEVLCHELAHMAVYELYGQCRPHGKEWSTLMRAAGYEPQAVMPPLEGVPQEPIKRRRRYLYIHRCPVCQAERTARRVVRRWRCAACSAASLDGDLEIWRRPLPRWLSR